MKTAYELQHPVLLLSVNTVSWHTQEIALICKPWKAEYEFRVSSSLVCNTGDSIITLTLFVLSTNVALSGSKWQTLLLASNSVHFRMMVTKKKHKYENRIGKDRTGQGRKVAIFSIIFYHADKLNWLIICKYALYKFKLFDKLYHTASFLCRCVLDDLLLAANLHSL